MVDDELWKKAYRKEFETDPDEDMREHAEDVELWRSNWQAGYDNGEEWARNMVEEEAA